MCIHVDKSQKYCVEQKETAIEKCIQHWFIYIKFHKQAQPHNVFFSGAYVGGKNFKEKQGDGWHKCQNGERYKRQEHVKTMVYFLTWVMSS